MKEYLNITLDVKGDVNPKELDDGLLLYCIANKLMTPFLSTKYKNIIGNREVGCEEADECIEKILAFMINNNYESISWDLEKVNEAKSQPKDMTIEEIEKELGYKIKIVREK